MKEATTVPGERRQAGGEPTTLAGVRVHAHGEYHEAVVVVDHGMWGEYATACGLTGTGYATVAHPATCTACQREEARRRRREKRARPAAVVQLEIKSETA